MAGSISLAASSASLLITAHSVPRRHNRQVGRTDVREYQVVACGLGSRRSLVHRVLLSITTSTNSGNLRPYCPSCPLGAIRVGGAKGGESSGRGKGALLPILAYLSTCCVRRAWYEHRSVITLPVAWDGIAERLFGHGTSSTRKCAKSHPLGHGWRRPRPQVVRRGTPCMSCELDLVLRRQREIST